LVGFIDGEGSFGVSLTKGKAKIGHLAEVNFNLTQHIRDAALFKLIQQSLGCGLVYEIPKDSRVNFIIRKSEDIINILIPKLNQYPLQGVKKLNFEDFKLIVELIKNKEHLTLEGLNKIIKIKSGMNTGRTYNQDKEDSPVSEISNSCETMRSSSFATATKNNISLKTNISLKNTVLQKREFHTSVRASLRIGPHNQDVLSVVIGSLLGHSAHANARTIEGTRISYRQSEIHKDYLFCAKLSFLCEAAKLRSSPFILASSGSVKHSSHRWYKCERVVTSRKTPNGERLNHYYNNNKKYEQQKQ